MNPSSSLAMDAGLGFEYDAAYFNGKLSDWTAISIGTISGKLLNTLRTQPYPRDGVVLDFGCGNGAYHSYLRQSSLAVVGADVSPEAVKHARQLPYQSVLLIEPGTRPLPDNSATIVFSTEVLEHIEDAEGAIREFNQMLKPDGLLILTTTLYFSSINVYLSTAIQQKHSPAQVVRETLAYVAGFFSQRQQERFVRKWCYEALGGHFHGFKTGALKTMIQRAGFNVIESAPLYIFPPIGFSRYSSMASVKGAFRFPLNLVMMAAVLVISLLNGCLKRLKIGANNIYLVARKIQPAEAGRH
jgi:2-polyprenyl-3-methyl-5-hydroxy-6-metoxy-1,4-benzoquinol methylase